MEIKFDLVVVTTVAFLLLFLSFVRHLLKCLHFCLCSRVLCGQDFLRTLLITFPEMERYVSAC